MADTEAAPAAPAEAPAAPEAKKGGPVSTVCSRKFSLHTFFACHRAQDF